jgi:hypothetical protein
MYHLFKMLEYQGYSSRVVKVSSSVFFGCVLCRRGRLVWSPYEPISLTL